MTHRRFIQDRETLEFHEVSTDHVPDAARCDSALWNDSHYDGLRATDGADIGSRTKHRDYMRRNGVTTVDDFHGEYWRSAEARRIAQRNGYDPARRSDIARAIAKLERGGK